MKQTKQNLKYVIVLISCLSFFQCYDAVDGCLDPMASNFDALADRDCDDDCCENPKITTTLRLRLDSVAFSRNTKIEYLPGDTIIVSELEFILSDFKLLDSSSNDLLIYGDEDSLSNSAVSIAKDQRFINSRTTSLDVAGFRYAGSFTGLDFRLGMTPSIIENNYQFEDVDFTAMRDSLFDDENNNYNTLNFSYFGLDSVVKRIQISDLELSDHFYAFPLDTFSRITEDHTFVLDFDLTKLWEGVNFAEQDSLNVHDIFKTNLKNAFTIQ